MYGEVYDFKILMVIANLLNKEAIQGLLCFIASVWARVYLDF